MLALQSLVVTKEAALPPPGHIINVNLDLPEEGGSSAIGLDGEFESPAVIVLERS